MADIGQQPATLGIGLGQAAAHGVEGPSQGADLVRAADLDPGSDLARLDARCGLDEIAERDGLAP